MKIPSLLLPVLLALLPGTAAAQAIAPGVGHRVEVLFTEAEVLAVTGDNDLDPSCLAVLPDGDVVFVDTEPGVDKVLHWDRATKAITVITDEPTLGSLAPGGPTSVVAFESLVLDSNNDILLLIGDAATGPPYAPIYFVRVPWTGLGNGYAASVPSLAGRFFDTDNYFQQMLIDRVQNRLLFMRDSGNSLDDASDGPGSNGIYSLTLFLPPPVLNPSFFALNETFKDQAGLLTPNSLPGTDDISSQSMAYGHGFAYLAHSVTADGLPPNFDFVAGEGYDGDFLRTDLSTSQSQLFIERRQFIQDTNRALGLSRKQGADIGLLQLLVDEQHSILYVLEDIPNSAVPVYPFPTTDAAAESLVAYDSLTGEFLGVVVSNWTFRSLYPALGITDFPAPGAGVTTFSLANFPLALGPDGAVYIFFVNTGEICLRVQPDHELLRFDSTTPNPFTGFEQSK